MRHAIRTCAVACFAMGLALTLARAQDYPNRPIRMIVAYPPGGGVDVAGRIIGQKLGEALGQQVVIENRPGASGVLGAEVVANAAPDGYTILISPGDFFVLPALMPPMAFDPSKDLVPIAMVSSNPLAVVASANAPFADLKQMVASGKALADGLAYATPGIATINHVVGEWIGVEAKLKMLHVPYRGGADAALAVVSGSVPLGIVSPPAVYPALVQSGKVKVIALTAAWPSFVPASWPTLAESGLAVEAALWLGIFAPSGTPAAIVSRLDAAVALTLQDDQVCRRMSETGTNPKFSGQAGLVDRIRIETAHYREVIQRAGIHIEH